MPSAIHSHRKAPMMITLPPTLRGEGNAIRQGAAKVTFAAGAV